MDKRKLSAIPRDNATEDMLEIARKLENIYHIVTARLIEDEKILLLNFYEVSRLKEEKTEAVFRTFLSADDYITQDLKQSNTKWLTASFHNMDRFTIADNCCNEKKKQYESISRILIRSEGERKIIENFFAEYKKTEPKLNYYYFDYPEPWESVRRFQQKVMDKRLEARHRKETDLIDAKMEPLQEPPQEFFDWIWETGMSFSRYVLYKEAKRGKAECWCTYCNQQAIVDRKEVRLRNNEKGKCPACGSSVTFKAKGKLAARNRDERWFAYVDSQADGFIFRYFHAVRILEGSSKISVSEHIREYCRAFYTFSEGKPKCDSYEWIDYKQTGKTRWCHDEGKINCVECVLYPGNLPRAWEHTPMKYSAFEVLSQNIPTVSVAYERGIDRYLKFPKIEWLCKMGLNRLAKYYIDGGYDRYGSVGKLNFEGKTIYEILGLTKINTKILQAVDGNNYELRLLQVAQTIGLQFKPEQLREYYETFECNTDLLKATSRKVSLHKLVRYISKESENYPIGDKGGCWKYAYMRYREREDPRIERKRNCAHDWLEYLEWCKALKYDLDNMFIYMPNNFKAVHDRTAKEYQALQDKKAAEEKRRQERKAARMLAQTKKAMEEIFVKKEGVDAFSIKGAGLILVVPQSGADIKAEGEALHHCVGGYVERVAQGKTNIFFVRKETEPDKPYFTLEWNNNKVVQCRGKSNCAMTAEVKAFVMAFEKKMLESINQGAKPRKLRRTG